ncbi:unnamed protein product [marine sediment metagenome]|uniref:Uncharacterized protein n=1 Tax=marine sediment metagenome TaxID=412755 RepID=X1UPD9_9ZZZZ
MAQEIAFAAPRAEEMTKSVTGLAGAGITGVVEGVIVKMAPQLGALEVPFTWAALLGVPAVGVAGALFSRGMIGDLMQGVAAGGTAVAAFTLPAMLMPDFFGRRPQGQLGAGQGVKQLMSGPLGAPQRAQARAAVTAEI